MSTVESEWDAEQRDYLAAIADWDADLGSHGHPMSEATSPLANPANPDARWLYVADLPTYDWALKAIEDKKDEYSARYKDNMPNGLLWTVQKVPLREGANRRV